MAALGPSIALLLLQPIAHAYLAKQSGPDYAALWHYACLDACSNQGGVRSALTGKAAATSKGKIEALLKQVGIGKM